MYIPIETEVAPYLAALNYQIGRIASNLGLKSGPDFFVVEKGGSASFRPRQRACPLQTQT